MVCRIAGSAASGAEMSLRRLAHMPDPALDEYRSFLDASPWPAWLVESDTSAILVAGRSAVLAYGYSAEEFAKMSLRDLLPPEERATFRLSTGDDTVPGRWPHLTRSGARLLVNLICSDVADATSLVLAHEIAPRSASGDPSQRAEARFRSLIENASDAITVLDDHGVIVYESPSAERSMGYRPEEMVGRRAIDFIHPDDRSRTKKALARAMRDSSGTHVLEYRLRHRDGSWRLREATGRNLLHDPDVRGFVINSRDVTSRREAEEALRRAEERQRFAMKAAGVGVWDWDLVNDALTWSEEMYALHGLPVSHSGPVTVERYFDLVHPDDREGIQSAVRQVIRHGTAYRREFRVVWPDGSVHWLAGRARVATSEEGEALRMTGIALDISEQKAVEQERTDLLLRERHARAEAERASQAKTNFLAVVSHELRTPLANIISFAELLEAEMSGPLAAHQKEHVRSISRSAWHLTDVVGEILEFSRVESGRGELRVEEVDAVSLVEQVVRETAPRAAAKGLSCRFLGSSGPVPIRTDPVKLRQILLNLVSNSIKFTREGEVRVEMEHASDEVVLRVVDSGVGISGEDQQHVFEAFWQAEPPMTRHSEGAGLGLAIARQLARLLGGDLSVESEPGVGSTFTLRLPRNPPAVMRGDSGGGAGS